MVRGGRHLGACQRRKLSSSLPKAADSESVLQEDSQVLFVLTWVCIAHLSLHCNSALTNHVILAKLHSLCVFFGPVCNTWGFPCSSVHKESACIGGDLGLIPGLGRFSGEGNGIPLQYFCLENPMDRGAWQATVHGVEEESVVGHNLLTKQHKTPPCILRFT